MFNRPQSLYVRGKTFALLGLLGRED